MVLNAEAQSPRRYAVYVVPRGDFGAVGAAWLGWDLRAGAAAAQPVLADLDLPALTETPRRYGFHATVMAPFHLRAGQSPKALARAFAGLRAGLAPLEALLLQPAALGRFIALLPEGGEEALRALQAQVLTALDGFRAPLSAADFARRDRPHMSAAQRAHLRRWGYPHVLDSYRFHLTLSAHAQSANSRRPLAAQRHFGSVPRLEDPVAALELVEERPDGRFALLG